MKKADNHSVWEPPATMPREEVVKTSETVLALPDIPVRQQEDIFRIHHVAGFALRFGKRPASVDEVFQHLDPPQQRFKQLMVHQHCFGFAVR